MTTGTDYIALLLQVPFLGVFIWYTLQVLREMRARDEDWRAALTRQMEALEAMQRSLEAMARQIERNTMALILHHASVSNQDESAVTLAEILDAVNQGNRQGSAQRR